MIFFLTWKGLCHFLYISDHTSHGSVSVIKTTFKVYGKRQTLTLNQQKNPEKMKSAFLLLWNKKFIFHLFIQKIRKKLQWRLWENFEIIQTVITSVVCKIES